MPPRAAEARGPPAGLVLHQAAAVLSLAGQAVFVLLQLWHGPVRGHTAAHMAALGLAHSAITLLMLKFPVLYWRNRWWLLSAIRIALFSLPSFRSMGMGLSLMLNHLPRPGVRGAAKDWGRILLGTRLASSVIVGLALPQRPIVTLATQAVLSLLIPNSPGYCQSQLLATPLTKQRMLAVATGLEAAALPLMVFAPSGVQWMQGAYKILDGDVDSCALCRALLNFQNAFIGVALPTLLACQYRWPHSTRPAARRRRAAAAAAAGAAAAGAATWRFRCMQLLSRGQALAADLDRWLIVLAGGGSNRFWGVLVWWYIVAVSWWVSCLALGIV